jgi:hypothetical protein
MIMPSQFPDNGSPDERLRKKPRAKSIAAENSRHDSVKRTSRAKHTIETIDWLALWALSIGFCAAFMAGIVVYSDHDNTGAAVILAGAAGIIALVLLVSEAPSDES